MWAARSSNDMIGTLSKDASEALLLSASVGRIGCTDSYRTYVVPIQYVYDGQFIYAHAVEGMKIHMMRKNPSVCFEVDEIKDVHHWKSVIVWGRYDELKNEYARYNTLLLFAKKSVQLKISPNAIPPPIDIGNDQPLEKASIRPVIFRIIIEEMTGRFENMLPEASTGK
ncbi:MAG TPA: pyridoxamine 5'-phosphate oxidase family protein [Chitinophagaceae bacterium]|nr:pyridoxamine 5'-phosphate oxidase family protein [Chitinophagaceae bacterium]